MSDRRTDIYYRIIIISLKQCITNNVFGIESHPNPKTVMLRLNHKPRMQNNLLMVSHPDLNSPPTLKKEK